eukprot:TRINITY_DN19631_c0_g1_i4.p1 TRINITY_DN19631_c0_g1~~TRINITY_DN19631_c0_g1_i4.p1  ORF type:complete len:333 (+),score=34.69 TRINITY_DN19631_c0_g1_i4:892-1890(+)
MVRFVPVEPSMQKIVQCVISYNLIQIPYGMHIGIVQVGQCGNQIGHQLWPFLLDTRPLPPLPPSITTPSSPGVGSVFVAADGRARCVLVDTEPKPIRMLTAGPLASLFREESIVLEQSGRGNNWAMGYFGALRHKQKRQSPPNGLGRHRRARPAEDMDDPELIRASMACIEREIERGCECGGLVFIHSLAGGTGSGVGSRLLELTRKSYPALPIINIAVAACRQGEVPVQNLNTVLTLAMLLRYSNAVLLFHNDEIISQFNSGSPEAQGTTLVEINTYITPIGCTQSAVSGIAGRTLSPALRSYLWLSLCGNLPLGFSGGSACRDTVRKHGS